LQENKRKNTLMTRPRETTLQTNNDVIVLHCKVRNDTQSGERCISTEYKRSHDQFE
jgi:hypothetical protein